MQKRDLFITELDLIRIEASFKATLCICFFRSMADYQEIIQYLHAQERNYYNTLKLEKRIRSYLMGRFAAKQAVAALISEGNLKNIFIKPGIFSQPIIVSNMQNIQVSITHCDDFGAALAFPEVHPMGIDLERICPNQSNALKRQITVEEEEKISSLPFSYETGLTLLWTVKEALSKVLKTGLTTPFKVFEISKAEPHDEYIICYYKNFGQYKAISFTIGSYICSIIYPTKTKIYLDTHSINEKFAYVRLNS